MKTSSKNFFESHKIFIPILLFILGIILYSNTLNNGFALDDTMMITKNNYTKGGIQGLKKIFTHDAFDGFLGEGKTLLPGGRYRPFSQAVFNIYFSAFGLEAFGLHLLNILLFAISILLVYKLLSKIFAFHKEAILNVPFIATLLYVVHPLNTEVVANIKSMDLLFAAVFSLWSVLFAIKYIETKRASNLLFTSALLFLGMLSKETSITFIALIPLILILFNKINLKQFLNVFGALILTFSLYFYIRFQAIGISSDIAVQELLNNPFLNSSTTEKYATIFYTWAIYIKLLLFPISLTHDYYPYVIEIVNFTNIWVVLSFIIYLLTTILCIRHLYRFFTKNENPNVYYFGFLYFIIIFSISSNLLFNIGAFMNERFIFLADIGIFIIIAKAFVDLNSVFKKNSKPLIILVLSIMALTFSIKTISRNNVWKDDYTLFTTDVKVSFNSAKCNVSAGGMIYEKAILNCGIAKNNMLLEAKKYLYQGIKIHPTYFQAWMLLGNVNYELQLWDECLQSYQNCLVFSKNNKDVLSNLKNLAIKSAEAKDYKISNNALNILSEHNYDFSNTMYLKATNMLYSNKIDSAIKLLRDIIKYDSLYHGAYNKLGEIYGRYKKDIRISEIYLIKAYEIKPSDYTILENLGVVYGTRGDFKKSLYFFKESAKSNPNKQQIYSNIALTYYKMNDLKSGKEWENKAKMAQE